MNLERTLGKNYYFIFILILIISIYSNGDSGGPLMKQITKPGSVPYFMLVGLVSYGPSDCGTKDQPG